MREGEEHVRCQKNYSRNKESGKGYQDWLKLAEESKQLRDP
jgi:hypothetical protein